MERSESVADVVIKVGHTGASVPMCIDADGDVVDPTTDSQRLTWLGNFASGADEVCDQESQDEDEEDVDPLERELAVM